MATIKNTIILVLIIAALLFVVGSQCSRIKTLKTERQQVIEFSNSQKQSATFYKNKLDRETAKVRVLDLTLNNTKDLTNNERLSFVKQFDGINKRLNNLAQITSTTAQIVEEWKLPLRDTFMLNLDSTLTTGKAFSYTDSLNRISGTIFGNQINPKIEITVPLQGAMYWQRNKILWLRIGKKKWFSDITSTNPFVKIKSHETIRIHKK